MRIRNLLGLLIPALLTTVRGSAYNESTALPLSNHSLVGSTALTDVTNPLVASFVNTTYPLANPQPWAPFDDVTAFPHAFSPAHETTGAALTYDIHAVTTESLSPAHPAEIAAAAAEVALCSFISNRDYRSCS